MDERRFDELWSAYADRVLGYALLRADRPEAEDAVTETFLVAWRRPGEVPADPLPWLLGVARKVLANSRRADTRRGALLDRLTEQVEQRPAPDHAEHVAAQLAVLGALRQLPPRDREVLVTVGVHGLTAAQAAAVLDCSTTALAVRLHRARRRLRTLLDPTQHSLSPASGAGLAEVEQ